MNKRTAKYKRKKIEKLKTIRVWPAVVGFVISVLLLVTLVIVSTSFALYNVIENKYDVKYDAAKYIADSIQTEYENGKSFDYVINKIKNNDICIIDQEKNIIASNGEVNIDFSWVNEIGLGGINETKSFYEPTYVNEEWFSHEGNADFQDVIKMSKNLFDGKHTDSKWLEEEFYNIVCWMVMPNEIGEYKVLIKADVEIVRKDFIVVIIVAAATGVFLLIPLVIMLVNIIKNVKVQKQMRTVIYLDEVTGGNNWTYFKDMTRKEITKRRNRSKSYMVVDLELMKYRSLCAYSGVDEGERVLEQINNIICANIGKKDVCSRYASANFALLVACKDEADAKSKIENIMSILGNVAGSHRLIYHAGYYMIDALGQGDDKYARYDLDIPAIYNNASAARASVASFENNQVEAFTDKLLEDQIWEHKVEEEMHNALANREFVVYYQPKYNPVTEELAGAEALIRWIKEDGIISPGKFIPIFEKNGFITKIDDYMIDNVARQQAIWLKEGRKIVPVSVNVSRAHFTQENLAEHILGIVDRYEVPHKYIEIELTESAFFDDKKALLGTVNKLKDYGFEISMDDFGAGYSSLNSLKDLPLDVLKLDADFFRGEDNNERAEIVVKEAISLGKQLEMRIVAEGIEKKNQVDFLANIGCDMIQGFYFAKPMPASEYEERMGRK